jgi:hypothetical protein
MASLVLLSFPSPTSDTWSSTSSNVNGSQIIGQPNTEADPYIVAWLRGSASIASIIGTLPSTHFDISLPTTHSQR